MLPIPYRSLLIGFFGLLLCFCCSTSLRAQVSRQSIDSANRARKLVLDSTRAVQKANLDAMRAARQHSTDSMRAARLKITDSLSAIRKYRESRHYRDSVMHSREARVASIRDASKARMDSVKDARKQVGDSMIAARKASTDIMKAAQKKRADSLGAIRKYRESKRYTDSVVVVRRVHMDSVKAERKKVFDAMAATRKASLDSMKAVRKTFTDSLTAARKVHTDSLKAVRKVKADALAKAKAAKAAKDKVAEKKKLTDISLKIDLARKKQQQKWDNTKMLKKKWSLPRQLVQNTFTRYNYYFNANRKMEEALANMQRLGKDDYDKNIPLFSFDPSKDSARFSADMDSVIQKASLGIQIHDPRGKWEDDLYLLLGQAYFFKGNFEQASNAFRYIVATNEKLKADAAKKKASSSRSTAARRKEAPSFVTAQDKSMLAFIKHTPANNDALLWLARTYTQNGQLSASESVLDLLASDSKFPEHLKGRLALEKAFYYLQSNNIKDAAIQLAIVSDDKSQSSFIRRRAAYLDGQLLQQQGSWAGAVKQFDIVTDLNPKIDMDFYARKAKAYSMMQAGEGTDAAIASLRGMVNDNKYLPYQEQVYYLLGQLSASSKKVPDAEKYFGQGLASAKTTRKQRAMTFAALGNLYYNTGAYENAKMAYDSAAKMASSAPDDANVKLAITRGKVLDKISSPARIIHTQDSLLELSAMTEKEQRAVVRRYMRSLNRAAANAANPGEENGALLAAAQSEEASADGGLSWYFTNPQLLLQGNNEFKRKWGNRPLADNWRRASAISQNSTIFAADSNSASQRDLAGNTGQRGIDNNNGLSGDVTESSLLAAIPNSETQKGIAATAIQRAYVDLATAYLRQLDDQGHATATLDTLDRRYPAHPHKAEELYVRYLIALKNNSLPAAQAFSSRLQQEYGNTQWAALVRPANEDGSADSNGPVTASVSDFYDETYGMMMQRQWPAVITRARIGRQRYADETYGNRFKIMEAIALAGQGQYGFADSMLSEFLRVHPSDSLHSWAEGALNFIQKQKAADTLAKHTGPAIRTNAAIINNPALKPVDTAALKVPAEFTYEPGAVHYFVFLFQHMESKALGVRAGTEDYNRLRLSGAPVSSVIIPIVQGGEGMVVVKPFKNAAAAKSYLQKWRAEPILTRDYKTTEYKTFIISEANYRKLLSDKNSAAYLSFYSRKY